MKLTKNTPDSSNRFFIGLMMVTTLLALTPVVLAQTLPRLTIGAPQQQRGAGLENYKARPQYGSHIHTSGGRADNLQLGLPGKSHTYLLPAVSPYASPKQLDIEHLRAFPPKVQMDSVDLRYHDTAISPRESKCGLGIAGIVDPGNYIRISALNFAPFSEKFISLQVAAAEKAADNGSGTAHGAAELQHRTYTWNGRTTAYSFISRPGFIPTRYIFEVAKGQVREPGVGYYNYLPLNYKAPISVAIREVSAVKENGSVLKKHEGRTYLYNACWDSGAGAYGFFDNKGQFNWLTFPWLESWPGCE